MAGDSGELLLRQQADEYVKQHIQYDGNGRMTSVHTARAGAENGAICGLTRYSYLSPTSNLVENMVEEKSVWDSSWDI